MPEIMYTHTHWKDWLRSEAGRSAGVGVYTMMENTNTRDRERVCDDCYIQEEMMEEGYHTHRYNRERETSAIGHSRLALGQYATRHVLTRAELEAFPSEP